MRQEKGAKRGRAQRDFLPAGIAAPKFTKRKRTPYPLRAGSGFDEDDFVMINSSSDAEFGDIAVCKSVDGVMDGELDGFITAYLQMQ